MKSTEKEVKLLKDMQLSEQLDYFRKLKLLTVVYSMDQILLEHFPKLKDVRVDQHGKVVFNAKEVLNKHHSTFRKGLDGFYKTLRNMSLVEKEFGDSPVDLYANTVHTTFRNILQLRETTLDKVCEVIQFMVDQKEDNLLDNLFNQIKSDNQK